MRMLAFLPCLLLSVCFMDPANAAAPPRVYANEIVVAKSGGDYTDPVQAVNAIRNASATNPYIVRIMPGVYAVGTTALQMKEYVDVEGAGENTTKISGTGANVIYGAPNSELRMLSVENGGGTADATAVRASGGMSVRNVSVTAAGGGYNRGFWISADPTVGPAVLVDVKVFLGAGAAYANYGIFNAGNATVRNAEVSVSGGDYATGISNYGGSMRLSDSNIRVADGRFITLGVYNYATPPSTFSNVTVSASGPDPARAIQNDQSAMDIDKSEIGGPVAVFSQGTTHLGYSKITAGQVVGTVKCVYLSDLNYDPYVCP